MQKQPVSKIMLLGLSIVGSVYQTIVPMDSLKEKEGCITEDEKEIAAEHVIEARALFEDRKTDKALRHLELAGFWGNKQAYKWLGLIYEDGQYGVSRNYSRALDYYRQAGHKRGMLRVEKKGMFRAEKMSVRYPSHSEEIMCTEENKV